MVIPILYEDAQNIKRTAKYAFASAKPNTARLREMRGEINKNLFAYSLREQRVFIIELKYFSFGSQC